MTTVFNALNDVELTYPLPPREAVVAAYEYDRGNKNTWTYSKPEDHPYFRVGKYGYICGYWWVSKKGE